MESFEQFELNGAERSHVLEKIARQFTAWGLAMPDVPTIPFHFGLHDFYTTGETELWLSNEIEAGYCSKFMFVFDGQTCPYHHHKVKHETFYIVKGTANMVVDGEEVVKKEGEVRVIKPGTMHSFTGAGPCLLLETSMPSVPGDSYFNDDRIGDNGVL